MRPEDAEALEEMERQHELGEIVRRVRRAISMGRIDEAEKYAVRVQQIAPETTTAEELLGDLAMERGEFEQAREHYQRALEIEPANADAEARLGEAVLRIREGVDARVRMQEAVENPEEYTPFSKSPIVAAVYSVVPGLGQLYNQQYEKGLALVTAAMLLLAWVLSEVLSYTGASMIAVARNPRLRSEAAQEIVEAYGPMMWTLVALAVAAYFAIWIYSIVDAYRTCARMAEEADAFGVELDADR